MKITMHGAGQEVGRSCIEVQWHDRRILLDCGIKIGAESNEYPTEVYDLSTIDALFLSHAHLDHSGALPLFRHRGLNCPIFCTDTTKETAKLMLKDSWKIERIEKRDLIYAKSAIREVIDLMRTSVKGKYKGISYRLIPSGHIPGSMSIFLEYKGETLLYTGDITGTNTHLLNRHKRLPKTDVLITEATYGNREHPARATSEVKFRNIINETIDRGGSALVAVFAIGRSQEMMLLLDDMKLKCPIYLDGMCKATTKIFLRHPRDLRDRRLFKAAKRVDMVTSWENRKRITKNKAVFIATSGMLDGGPIMHYLKHLGGDTNNALILTGYQADDSNGRCLLDHGYVHIDGEDVDIRCPVYHLDFSGHAGESSLHEIIKQTRPKAVITNHGEPGSCKSLAAFAQSRGCRAYAPATGQTIDIEVKTT